MARILILGAASDIAYAIGKKLAAQYDSCSLILAGRNITYLQSMADDFKIKSRVECEVMEFDAQNFEEHRKIYDAIIPKPDIAIICFGYLGDQGNAIKNWGETKKIIETNYTGVVSVVNLIANDFESCGKGVIVGISSVAGDRGRGSNYIYGSAKAGMSAYLSGLRNRLSKSNVHVVTVKPGFVRTKMTSAFSLPPLLTATPEQVAAAVVNAIKKQKNIVYSLGVWRIIMFLIKLIPERLFKKMNL